MIDCYVFKESNIILRLIKHLKHSLRFHVNFFSGKAFINDWFLVKPTHILTMLQMLQKLLAIIILCSV